MNPALSVSDKNFVGLPRFAVWEKSVSRFKLMIILKFKYLKTLRPFKVFNRFRYWFV